MTAETISLFLGAGSGALIKIIGNLVQSSISMNKANLDIMVSKQKAADESADAAAARSGAAGVWVRRLLVCSCLFVLCLVPLIMAFSGEGMTVSEPKSFLGIINWTSWKTLEGFVLMPEIRQTMLAITGYYLGSSNIK